MAANYLLVSTCEDPGRLNGTFISGLSLWSQKHRCRPWEICLLFLQAFFFFSPWSLMEILNCRAAVSELRWLTFTSCCFIAYYCARLSSGSRFGQLQSSQGTRRGGATRAWWGYWWGTYRKPHIIHTHQPQHVTPNEASAAFKRLIAQCLPLPSDPLLILRSELGSNSSCLAKTGLRLLAASPRVLGLCLGNLGEQILAGWGDVGRQRSVRFRFSQRGIPFPEGALD